MSFLVVKRDFCPCRRFDVAWLQSEAEIYLSGVYSCVAPGTIAPGAANACDGAVLFRSVVFRSGKI